MGVLCEVLREGGGREGEVGGPAVGNTQQCVSVSPRLRPSPLLHLTQGQREDTETRRLQGVAGEGQSRPFLPPEWGTTLIKLTGISSSS